MADPVAPSAPEWEVLSMSMSASASASLVCCCDSCTGLCSGNHNCIKQSSHITEPQTSAPASSGLNWMESVSLTAHTDLGAVNTPAHVEPFTEGWKPRPRSVVEDTPDHTSILGSEQSSFQEDFPEGTCSADEIIKPLVGLQQEVFMAAEESMITQAYAGERILADADKLPKKKARKAQATGVFRKPTVVLSLALAATVVGIVIIRQRWQLEQQQNQQLRLELGTKEARLNDLMYQFNRLKEAVARHGKV